MAISVSTAAFAATFAIALMCVPADPVRASSLMSACKVDVDTLCSGVKEGRGRISACLFAHGNKISGTCKPELTKVTSSGTFKKMVPAGLNDLKGSERDTRFRQVCAGDIKSHCGSVGAATDRVLACLYAWSNRLTKPCHAEARAMLEGD